MSELKRCPFCGGEAEFYRTPIKTNGGYCDSVVVRCKECEARTNRILYDARKHQNDSEYDEAAAYWNTRKSVENTISKLASQEVEFIRDDEQYIKLRDAIRIVREETECDNCEKVSYDCY